MQAGLASGHLNGVRQQGPMGINDTDPVTLVQFLLLIALGVVIALIYVWIGPVLARSGNWSCWHRADAGPALQAPLDQSLLGMVHRRRPEQPILLTSSEMRSSNPNGASDHTEGQSPLHNM